MVNYSSIDTSKEVIKYIKAKGFVFNPSIAHVTDDTYIYSVRHFAGDKLSKRDITKNPHKNYQHPWKSFWQGESGELKEDISYLLPVSLNGEFKTIKNSNWPITVDGQDLRIFKFYRDDEQKLTTYILTYNKLYNDENVVVKSGKSCEDWCYIIGWSYLVVTDDLQYSLVNSKDPLCSNISGKLDKNWSLWNMEISKKIIPMISYMLTPDHIAFNWNINKIEDGEVDGGYSCKLLTPEEIQTPNFFAKLQEYYDNKIFVSLSTPAYGEKSYLAVGHMKARIHGLKGRKGLLGEFYKNTDPDYLHQTFIYFMFFYRFTPKVLEADEEVVIDSTAGSLTIERTEKQFLAPITHISPAFIVDEGVNYLLNFPSGLVQDRYKTYVSYGNGDSEARILKISNRAVNDLLKPVDSFTPETYPFAYLDQL
jgi:hypothetical protein